MKAEYMDAFQATIRSADHHKSDQGGWDGWVGRGREAITVCLVVLLLTRCPLLNLK